ncbi:MAG: hypothetical protein M3Y80_05335 [Verrucomicrobiota bacterium]|nr:hypothetical protein [Verrucomicrobiota bacterium]
MAICRLLALQRRLVDEARTVRSSICAIDFLPPSGDHDGMKSLLSLLALVGILTLLGGCAGEDGGHYTSSQVAAQHSQYDGPY